LADIDEESVVEVLEFSADVFPVHEIKAAIPEKSAQLAIVSSFGIKTILGDE
jgi:hypothetical protein